MPRFTSEWTASWLSTAETRKTGLFRQAACPRHRPAIFFGSSPYLGGRTFAIVVREKDSFSYQKKLHRLYSINHQSFSQFIKHVRNIVLFWSAMLSRCVTVKLHLRHKRTKRQMDKFDSWCLPGIEFGAF